MPIFKNSAVVIYELDNKVDEPFSPTQYTEHLTRIYEGEVSFDGKWVDEAAAGWKVSKLETGKYKIEHYLCNRKFSLNMSLVNQYGTIVLGEVHDMYFTVEISENVDGEKEYKDKDFVFSVCFIQPTPEARRKRLR